MGVFDSGPFSSLSSLLGNPQAAAGAVAGPPQPTPTLQQQPGMSPTQLMMLRDYIKQLQKHNLEPVGPTGGMGQALAANLAKGLASGITGYSMYQAGENEKEALRQGAEAAVPNFGTPGSPSPGSPPVGGGGTVTKAEATPELGDTPLDRALSHTARNETGSPWSKESAGGDSPDAFHSRSYGSLGLNTHYGSVPEGWHDWDPYKKMAYEKQYYGKIYNDIPDQLQRGGFSADIANNPGTKAYMADRAIQMGNTGQVGAYNAARGASTPQEFMDRVTKYDKATLPQHFHTALSERPNIYQGLQNRVDKRHSFAMSEASGGAPGAAPTAVAAAPIAPVAGAGTPTPAPVGNLPAPATPSAFDKPNQDMVSAVAGPQGVPPPSAVGADTVAALNGPRLGGAPPIADYTRGLDPTRDMAPPVSPQAKETANVIQPGTVPTPAGEAPLTNPQLTSSTGGPLAPPELSQPGGMTLDKPIIPPESVPRRPMYSRDQMVRIMSNPYMDPSMKQQAYQSYLQQNQEIPVPYKGMGTVYVNPTSGAQRWVPDPIKSERKVGGISTNIIQFYNPRTNQLEEVPSGPPGGENGPTGGARPKANLNSVEGMMQTDVQHQSELAGGKATAEKRSEAYEKRRDSIMKRSQDVRDEIPQLQLLKRIIADPNYRSGLLSGRQADLDQIGKAIGVTSGKMADTYQLAKKLGSAASLQSVRMMGEIGAVRIPEMHMVEKSTYDPNNTPEVNNAVVEINLRSAMRESQVGEMAREYLRTHKALDDGFEQVVADRFKAEPLFNDKELGNFNSILDRGRGDQAGSPGAGGATAQPKSLESGKTVVNGNLYKGGNPKLPSSWEAGH